MSPISFRRWVAVSTTLAVSLVAPALVTGSATAAATQERPRADSSLSISAVKSAVQPGGSTGLVGRLRIAGVGGAADRRVTLEARAQGEDGFTPLTVVRSGDRGRVHTRVSPEVSTLYRWRFSGGPRVKATRSGVVRVRVRTPQHPPHRVLTALSIRLKDHAVEPGDATVVAGKLRTRRGPVAHQWVVLVSRTAPGEPWEFGSAQRTGDLGHVAFQVQPDQATAYRLRFQGTARLRPSHSARVAVRIRPTVTIQVSPHRIDAGESATVTGSVVHQGAPAAGATVRLLARRIGAHRPADVLQTATAGDDGSVSFTVAPDRSTAYRLRVVREGARAWGVSPVRRVWVRKATALSIGGRTAGADGFRVKGRLAGDGHGVRDRKVVLQSSSDGTGEWTRVDAERTNHRGAVTFLEEHSPGTEYRLVFRGDRRWSPATSATVVS